MLFIVRFDFLKHGVSLSRKHGHSSLSPLLCCSNNARFTYGLEVSTKVLDKPVALKLKGLTYSMGPLKKTDVLSCLAP